MGRVVESGEALTQVLASEEVLKKVIQCIAAEKISVAKEVQLKMKHFFFLSLKVIYALKLHF